MDPRQGLRVSFRTQSDKVRQYETTSMPPPAHLRKDTIVTTLESKYTETHAHSHDVVAAPVWKYIAFQSLSSASHQNSGLVHYTQRARANDKRATMMSSRSPPSCCQDALMTCAGRTIAFQVFTNKQVAPPHKHFSIRYPATPIQYQPT